MCSSPLSQSIIGSESNFDQEYCNLHGRKAFSVLDSHISHAQFINEQPEASKLHVCAYELDFIAKKSCIFDATMNKPAMPK